MKIRLVHPFIVDSRADWEKILDKVEDLASFERRIKKFCDSETDYLTEDERGQKIRTFLGDAWEVFVEMLLKTHAYDRRIGVSAYRPCHSLFGDEDHGVDGIGIGTNGRICTVQAKFRGDPQSQLTANGAHLSNFVVSSQNEHGVLLTDRENMLVLTNCQGLHHFSESKMLQGKVRCLGRDAIRQFVDNNLPFWQEFRQATTLVKEVVAAVPV